MKNLILIVLLFCVLNTKAQNFLISFSGTGESSTVSTVKVENLMSGTSLILNGSDILRLTVATGVNPIDYKESSGLNIYPNPMTDNTILRFYPPIEGNAFITVFDLTGKPVSLSQSYLEKFKQEFRISGVEKGLYLINVRGNNYQFTGKLISSGKSNGTISIEKVANIVQADDEKELENERKGTQSTIDMVYATGDRIKFTGISGIYSTVITDIPATDKTITFNFIACTDADNNNYPVVKIGTQVWMVENLKYLPSVVGHETASQTTPYYYVYGYDGTSITDAKATSNYANYGVLYNWPAAMNGAPSSTAIPSGVQGACPTGWHVPSKAEWIQLIDYLGGESAAGSKLKETGTSHWASTNNDATNETGLTSLPGGFSSTNGIINIGSYGYLWTTNGNSTNAWAGWMGYNTSAYSWSTGEYHLGFSVRCLQGEVIPVPILTTSSVSSITQTTALSGGNIIYNPGSPVTDRGLCWNTTGNPVITNNHTSDGTGNGAFTSNMTGLTPLTQYYVRAYAKNNAGTAYGDEISFVTIGAPVLTTTSVSSITQTTAISGGNITSDGGSSITSRGVCWSTSANPTIADSHSSDGTGTGIFGSNLTGLTFNVTYFIRSYATNSTGTGYGNQLIFYTNIGVVPDIDGNTYNIVTIGSQIWMAENLKTSRYSDGTAIPLVTDNTLWGNAVPAYCWYNNDESTYKQEYGALYNWYAVSPTTNGGKNLCPDGWHVPSVSNWSALDVFLGGEIEGGKQKEAGTTHWLSPNTGATNSSGFTGLPGGMRYFGAFQSIGGIGYWWSSSLHPLPGKAYPHTLSYSSQFSSSFSQSLLGNGLSVRCIKD